jgi:hypothetical protein
MRKLISIEYHCTLYVVGSEVPLHCVPMPRLIHVFAVLLLTGDSFTAQNTNGGNITFGWLCVAKKAKRCCLRFRMRWNLIHTTVYKSERQ